MKPQNLVVCFAFVFVCCSCKKNEIAYDGVVYSKHRYPMPGVNVIFTYSPDGKSTNTGAFTTATDANGKFSLNKTIGRKDVMESVSVTSDSGHYDSGLSNRKAISNMEIILE